MAPSPTPTMVALGLWPFLGKITVAWEWWGGAEGRSWTGTLYTQIWRNEDGGSFSQVKTFTNQPDREAWDHAGCSSNVVYGYKLRFRDDSGNGSFSNIMYRTMYSDDTTETIELDEDAADQTDLGDKATDTIELSESTSSTGKFADSAIDTVRMFDAVGDAATLTLGTNYQYYFGDFSGKIYLEHKGYDSDNGAPIHAFWLSKETDFADTDPDALGKFKTVYKVRLFYVDKSAGQTILLSLSTDSGITWTDSGRNVGTGDGATKWADFFFIETGDVFQFKITHNADSGKFQWINFEVYYSIGGDCFEVN